MIIEAIVNLEMLSIFRR
jgi:phosphatidylinositol phospholipase C beta